MSEPKTNDELEAYHKKEFISPTDAQTVTRRELRVTDKQANASEYDINYIRYMESIGWFLRVQDDRLVHFRIARDGSYPTSIMDKD